MGVIDLDTIEFAPAISDQWCDPYLFARIKLSAAEAAGNLPIIGERAQMAATSTAAGSLTRHAVIAEYSMAKAVGNLPTISERGNLFMQYAANSPPVSTLIADRTLTEKTGS
jgi:hypothetical protein